MRGIGQSDNVTVGENFSGGWGRSAGLGVAASHIVGVGKSGGQVWVNSGRPDPYGAWHHKNR